MAKKRKGSVRMGPISIFSLIITLCLAVMATLSISTAQATLAATQRQAASTESVYADEVAAQEFMAELDAQLSTVRAAGGGRANALSALQQNVNALAEAGASDEVTVNVTVATDTGSSVPTLAENADVKATFAASDGRTLNVALAIVDNATYEVLQWKTTTTWVDTNTGNTLWSGTSTNEE